MISEKALFEPEKLGFPTRAFINILAVPQISALLVEDFIGLYMLRISLFSVDVNPEQPLGQAHPWQLQSFQIMKLKKALLIFMPLYHIQWSRKAYPQTTVSFETVVCIKTTFQAGSQSLFRQFEKFVVNSWFLPTVTAFPMLLLIKVQISVRLEELMFPQPCQSRAEKLPRRESIKTKKIALVFFI